MELTDKTFWMYVHDVSCLHFISSSRPHSPGVVLIDVNQWSSHHFSLLHVPSRGCSSGPWWCPCWQTQTSSFTIWPGIPFSNRQGHSKTSSIWMKPSPLWGVTREGCYLLLWSRGIILLLYLFLLVSYSRYTYTHTQSFRQTHLSSWNQQELYWTVSGLLPRHSPTYFCSSSVLPLQDSIQTRVRWARHLVHKI